MRNRFIFDNWCLNKLEIKINFLILRTLFLSAHNFLLNNILNTKITDKINDIFNAILCNYIVKSSNTLHYILLQLLVIIASHHYKYLIKWGLLTLQQDSSLRSRRSLGTYDDL